MAIINIDGFDFFENLKREPDALIIKQDLINKQVDYVKKHKITSISLFDSFSGNIENLRFLEDINFIQKIQISGLNVDYSDLYNLKDLRSANLSVRNKGQQVQFSKFPLMESLSVDWYPEFPYLKENENLKKLALWKFKPKSKSCVDLILPQSIEIIEFVQSNILNFQELNLTNLKILEAHNCRDLESLDGIEQFNSSLRSLIIDHSKNLTKYNKLSYCGELERVIISHCGNIPNLKWLVNLKKLKHFSFWETKLDDGDVSLCKGIDYVSFKNSKNYNYKIEEINLKK